MDSLASMLMDLRSLVEHESPSRDKPALDALGETIAGRYRALGADVETIANPLGGDHLRIRFGKRSGPRLPALILGHFDTVWPIGTFSSRPFRIEGGRAYGPGIYDMKAGLIIVEFAIRSMLAEGSAWPRPVTILLTSDEEIGSPTSRRLIEDEARGCDFVLVVEPPLSDGSLKTERKGVGQFVVEIEGRAAHAGVEPEQGRSAVLELAHQILRIHGLADPAAGTTVNVGVVQGGTAANVVAARATATVDVRVRTASEARRIEYALKSLEPHTPGVRLSVTGAINRPPMERTPQSRALFDRARQIGQSLGLDLTEGATGGGSDGNFTSALGVPTLDGLGSLGGGAHADDEHVRIESLPQRAALLAALLHRL